MLFNARKLIVIAIISWSSSGWSIEGIGKPGGGDYIGIFEVAGAISYCNIVSCDHVKMSLILHKRILGPNGPGGAKIKDADVERVIACSPVALPIGREYLMFLRYRNGKAPDLSMKGPQVLSPEANCQFDMDLESIYARQGDQFINIESVNVVDVTLGKRSIENADLMSLVGGR